MEAQPADNIDLWVIKLVRQLLAITYKISWGKQLSKALI